MMRTGLTLSFALTAVVLAACGGTDPTEAMDGAGGEASSGGAQLGGAQLGGGSEPGAGDAAGKDCSTAQEGCSCAGEAPVACWTGPAELRGKPGCKDGVRTCERRGEFSAWSACVGEETACSSPTPPALTPPPGGGGVPIASPDYAGCAALPQAGKRSYGQCADDHVVVIVNDGKAQEMTCCPVGKNVLSSVTGERHVLRTGVCAPDEVATGMQNPHTPGVFCTKINTTFLKLSTPTTAKYVTGKLPGVLGQIASSYNVNDTCVCEEGSVVLGGHTPQDNVCADKCARIEKK